MDDENVEVPFDGPIDVDSTPPDSIIGNQQNLITSAIAKLVALGLSDEEARAVAGLRSEI